MMKTLYRKVIGIGIVAVIFYFIGRVIYKEWDKISGYHWSPNLAWLTLSILLLFFMYLMAAYGWMLVIRMIGAKVGWGKGLSIFLISLFGRYIPGGVWSVLGRIYLCRLEGISDSMSSMSVMLEQAYVLVSAGIVFAASLFFWGNKDAIIRVLPTFILLPIFIFFLHPKPFLKVANPVLSWLGKGHIMISLRFNNMLILTSYYFFYWIVAGIAFYFFIRAFYPLELYYIPILSGIYAISFSAGYLSLFAPAGIGVREGILTILLSIFIPMPVAIGVALLSRLWIIGVELLILIIFLVNSGTRKMVRVALGW